MSSPRPYRIEVPDDVLEDLRDRLGRTRWPREQMPDAGWDYGANLDYAKSLCAYWRDGYDWRAQEERLNEYPQFVCDVDGVDIHYWHVKGKGPNPFPLMLIHGWPGSIFEFYETIGPLTDPAAHGGDPADSFDLVIPSLPGFGFSGEPRERGWGTRRIAEAFDKLMTEVLGYERYGAQGGDWGAGTCARLAANHAETVAAVHITAANAPEPEGPLDDEDRAYLERFGSFRDAEGAYYMTQGTKPDSLTVAQADSPAGLAAWIVEKFRSWSDCGGDVESVFSKDQLITNLMFYWAPNSVASSAHIYWEMFQEPDDHWMVKTSAPVAFAVFPAEAWMPPRRWLEEMHDIVQWTEMPAGGHFDAFEQPQLMTEDLRKLFRRYR